MTRNSPPPRSARMMQNVPRYQALRRTRSLSRLRRPASSVTLEPEAITRTTKSVDQLGLETIVDLPAEATHENFQNVREWIVVLVPHVRSYRRAANHDPVVRREKLEQRELLCRELD